MVHRHLKRYSLLNHMGNANQNHNDIPSPTNQISKHLRTDHNKFWKWSGNTGDIFYNWWKYKLVAYFGILLSII